MADLGPLATVVLNRAPKFLRGKNIGRLLTSAARMNDDLVISAQEGLRLSNPLTCDVSAFPALSKDRKTPLYPNQPEASKRLALSRWRQRARSRASEYGTMVDLQTYFYTGPGALLPTIYSVHQTGDGASSVWRILGAAGSSYTDNVLHPSNFNYDGQAAKWSRVWYFIDMTGTVYTSPYTYGDGDTYGDGIRYGEGGAMPFTGPQQADLIQIVLDDNAPHAWPAGLVFIWDASRFAWNGTPTQDASGWWSLPNGKWGQLFDPVTGRGTRPPYLEWVLDNPAP